MKVRPILKLFVGDFEINHKTTFEDIKSVSNEYNVLWKAWELFQNSAYPKYCKDELMNYSENDIRIVVSNHIKWSKEKQTNPEWFNVL